jgi:hypothetical protein
MSTPTALSDNLLPPPTLAKTLVARRGGSDSVLQVPMNALATATLTSAGPWIMQMVTFK